ncbi:hypothetical protein GCM10012275_54610 [Longimycelium tulufanense]|uniref:Phage portal protein n=1 Tax=Longimycelium tulufanense TaxID=907463 RepID=A0A8J3CHQ8_9PSEU|nr:phage portal protein [Longimycelium tulufanense]GGM77044.1 hypothetical protein GCM10012275_54610 [Longimycelium tulufanense]
MPLPDGDTPWPPPQLAPVFDRLAAWSAWYGGDPDELETLYGESSGLRFDSTSRARLVNHPSQYRGGVVGRLARWFWGQPTPLGERRTKLHVPLAGDIAAKSADLLFSEPPTFTVDDMATQDRLLEHVEEGLHATLLEAADVCAGLGGVYLRVCWDRDLADRPWLSPVHADAAVPEWSWAGRLTAVTFWRVLADDGGTEVVRHLERHERGRILHGVYVGTRERLGRRVPLTEYPETTGLAESLSDGNVIDTGNPGLTAVYVPNMRPNRTWRTIPAATRLGRSDYASLEPFLDALDEVYSSWLRDIRLAKGRILLPSVYLQSNGPGQPATWDADREVYAALNQLPNGTGQQITLAQFAIRHEEHSRTAIELMSRIVQSAGYSVQSFGLSSDVAVTATEVTARERQSMVTRARKILYWRAALAETIDTLLAVDRAVFGAEVEPQRPNIEFADSVSQDPESMARTLQLLTAAEAASLQTRVEMLHPDWDADQVRAEVKRIRDDTGRAVVEPDLFRGIAEKPDEPAGEGQGGDDEQPDEHVDVPSDRG